MTVKNLEMIYIGTKIVRKFNYFLRYIYNEKAISESIFKNYSNKKVKPG